MSTDYVLRSGLGVGNYTVESRPTARWPKGREVGQVHKAVRFGLTGWLAFGPGGISDKIPDPVGDGGRWPTRSAAAWAVWDRHLHPLGQLLHSDGEHHWPIALATADYLEGECGAIVPHDDGAWVIAPGYCRDDLDELLAHAPLNYERLGELTA